MWKHYSVTLKLGTNTTQKPCLKSRRTSRFMQRDKRRKETADFYMEALKRLLLHLFVPADICLHLWNACALLWQRSRSLVRFFVRAPAFNRSGLHHINTVRKRRSAGSCGTDRAALGALAGLLAGDKKWEKKKRRGSSSKERGESKRKVRKHSCEEREGAAWEEEKKTKHPTKAPGVYFCEVTPTTVSYLRIIKPVTASGQVKGGWGALYNTEEFNTTGSGVEIKQKASQDGWHNRDITGAVRGR